ncbi:MAG: septum site-determining protein MinC [Pseudomonadota bacterium]
MVADPTLPPDPTPTVRLDSASRPPLIVLDREASFDRIRDDLKEQLTPLRAVWDGAEIHLDLGLREPDLFHLRRLVHLLADDFGVHVVGMRCDPGALRRFAERELKVRIHLGEPEPEAQAPSEPPVITAAAEDVPEVDLSPEPPEPTEAPSEIEEPEPTGSREGPEAVRVERRTLRSGAVLRHGGDIILYGDVNPGAEIVAGGTVTVLGTLMGVAHAGTRSGDRAWVLALDLKATQLRIGHHIHIPGQPGQTAGGTARAPELAQVRDGAIVIEPWRGRLPREDTRRSDA